MNHLTLLELIKHIHQFGTKTPVEAELLRRLEALVDLAHGDGAAERIVQELRK